MSDFRLYTLTELRGGDGTRFSPNTRFVAVEADTELARVVEEMRREREESLYTLECYECDEWVDIDALPEGERTWQQWHCPECGHWNDRAQPIPPEKPEERL